MMQPIQRHQVAAEIGWLLAEFAYRLDNRSGVGLHELFAVDGQYIIDGEPLVGRDAIEDAYRRRVARGPRTARHLFSNARFESLEGTEALHTSVMLLYAADGEPALPLEPPLSIFDVVDHLVHTDEGWLFQRREFFTVFRGAGSIVSPQSAMKQTEESSPS
jgi:hypothetical protein